MNPIIPDSLVILGGDSMYSDTGCFLVGEGSDGQDITIQIRQTDIQELEDAGRLLFNLEPIEVRSETEAAIIELLEKAEIFDPDHPQVKQVDRIDRPRSKLTDKDQLERIRRRMIDYLQSDRYVEIAEKRNQPPLKPWEIGRRIKGD